MGDPQNGWFVVENPMKWMMLGYPHFRKPPHHETTMRTGFPEFPIDSPFSDAFPMVFPLIPHAIPIQMKKHHHHHHHHQF